MKKHRIFLWLILLFMLSITAFFIFEKRQQQDRKIEERQTQEEARSSILNSKVPITDKVGSFVWLYAYKKDTSQNWMYIRSQLKIAKKSDLRYVVLPIVFKKEYIKSGKFDYSEFDRVIKQVRKEKLKPIIVFSADNVKDVSAYRSHSGKVIQKYENLMKDAVIRYKDNGIVWQMWNEPNSLFWFNQSEDGNNRKLVHAWIGMEKNLYHFIRKNDPNSIFLGGALAGNYSDSKNTIKLALNDGLASTADAIANHPYISSVEPNKGAPENLLVLNSRNILVSLTNSKNIEAVKKIPLVTTEMGYSMGKTHHGIWSEGDQANYLARSIFILDMLHQPIISLYSLVDEGNGSGQWGMYRGNAPDYAAKQSGELITQLLSNLEGYRLSYRVNQYLNQDFVLLYIKTGQHKRYVCWTTGTNHQVEIANQKVTLSQTPQIVYEK
ncbi:hypothetical protein [Lactiplantibacillus songbeiensis]|uniref:Glycoside hydrolase family 5 domain-containing protein n=1 Tax=Lactiplantibacillus songbeiensis TaxID=2559920 RepID=A0ABW4C1C5_9LACO|nr:hypothetical protein [Lactiplantibacillus songbeiensis]